MLQVEIGQLWEIYSRRSGRWMPVTLTALNGERVTFRDAFMQFHSTTLDRIQDRTIYRCVSE